MLSCPGQEEILYAYLAVTNHAVSLVLIRVDSRVQRLVYYVSKSLQDAEMRYSHVEKAILALICATRKLTHYLQAYMVVVLTQLPLQAVLQRLDYFGRVVQWGTMLGAFDIKYQPRTSIKGQVLADLVVDFSEDQTKEGIQSQEAIGVFIIEISPPWTVYIDGAANQQGSRVGVVIVSPDGIVLEKSLRLSFSATNNEAEYVELWSGLEAVEGLGGNSIEVFSDFPLIVGQVLGEYEAKVARMQANLGKIKQLQAHF